VIAPAEEPLCPGAPSEPLAPGVRPSIALAAFATPLAPVVSTDPLFTEITFRAVSVTFRLGTLIGPSIVSTSQMTTRSTPLPADT
jgi:hypothetical protein